MFLQVDPQLKKLQAICLADTLELVLQTYELCQNINGHCKFSLGWAARDELVPNSADIQILIGTPSAVLGAVNGQRRGAPAKLDASQVKILIIDEANELVKRPPPPRRGGPPPNVTFFKTLDKLIRGNLPRDIPIGFFSSSFSEDAIKVIKEWRPQADSLRRFEVPKDIHHFYFEARNPETDVVPLLARIASRRFVSQGIIFLTRKDLPEGVAQALTKLQIECRWVTNDTDRSTRAQTLTDLRENKFKFLATTNLYARGIDIPEVFLVIQVGISRVGQDRQRMRPNVTDYQRRTSRAGRAGVCINVITPDEVPLIQQLERELRIEIKRWSEEMVQTLPGV
jgi:ATP-dependent RNA helicase DDX19/DBP5